jgi:hypothetical protein
VKCSIKSGERNYKTQNIEFQNLILTKIMLYGEWKGACQQFSIKAGYPGQQVQANWARQMTLKRSHLGEH